MTLDRSTRVKHTADNTPAIVQLTLSRFREFYREPEAVFWVFIFPILLAGGLGIAFRGKPKLREAAGTSLSASGLDAVLFLLGLCARELLKATREV